MPFTNRTLTWLAAGLMVAACGTEDPTRPGGPVVTAVVVTPVDSRLDAIGASVQLSAEARDASGAAIPGISVEWQSSNPAAVSVSATGRATAVAPGTATVSATASGVSGSSQVVVEQVVTSITAAPAQWTADALQDTVRLVATPRDANGHPVPGRLVTWSSADEEVATVDAVGKATAIANGTTTLTMSTGEVTQTVAISVEQQVAELTVAPEVWSPEALGSQQQFTAQAKDGNGHDVADWEVTWNSTAATTVSVTADGMATALASGGATIAAAAAGKQATATVQVMQVVDSVVIAPTGVTLVALGADTTLVAAALDAGGSVIPNLTPAWASSQPTVATVSDAGVVTAVAGGSTTVTATIAGTAATAQVTVNPGAPPPPAMVGIAIAPGDWTATVAGQQLELVARAVAEDGSESSLSSPITWSTLDQTIARVNESGVVTALASGSTRIVATSNGFADTMDVAVDVTGAIADGIVWSVYFAAQWESPAYIVNGNLVTPRAHQGTPPYEGGNVAKYASNGDVALVLTDVVGGVGTLRVRERVGEWRDLVVGNARDFQLEGDRIGVLFGDGSLRVKASAIASWTTVWPSNVTAFQLEGNRIGVLDNAGVLRVRDGLSGSWSVPVNGSAKAFQLDGNRIGVLHVNGDVGVKQELHGPWSVPVSGSGVAFQLEGARLAVLQTNGTLRYKQEITGPWYILSTVGVQKFALDGNRIAILLPNGAFRAKDSPTASWVTHQGVADFDVHRGRILIRETGGKIRGKVGSLGSAWSNWDVQPTATRLMAGVSVPAAPHRTTPASYQAAQAGCTSANACVRVPYIPPPFHGFQLPIAPVPVYGRHCGDGRPAGGTPARIDGMDELCWHHDRLFGSYEAATGDLQNDYAGACIVRYGIVHARMTKNGDLLPRNSAAERNAFSLMPNLAEARYRYLNWTSSCTSSYLNQFTQDTRLDL